MAPQFIDGHRRGGIQMRTLVLGYFIFLKDKVDP
jgi:hypothetical protein